VKVPTQKHDRVQLMVQAQNVTLELQPEVAFGAFAVTIVVDTCELELALTTTRIVYVQKTADQPLVQG
jgi:hypothetical protein